LEVEEWFKQLEEKVDLWITDPPYPFDTQNGTGRYQNMYQQLGWADLEDVYKKMYEHSPDGARAYVFCNRDGRETTKQALSQAGWTFRNELIWDKLHFGGGYHYRNQVEYIVYVTKGKPKTYVKGRSNVFRYKRPTKNSGIPKIGYDPTSCASPKPWEIWDEIMIHGACEGDVCADPFAGSNPMKAALNLNHGIAGKIKLAYTNIYET
jgi:site-specific DNA-methyltransferase (adenine-specific)